MENGPHQKSTRELKYPTRDRAFIGERVGLLRQCLFIIISQSIIPLSHQEITAKISKYDIFQTYTNLRSTLISPSIINYLKEKGIRIIIHDKATVFYNPRLCDVEIARQYARNINDMRQITKDLERKKLHSKIIDFVTQMEIPQDELLTKIIQVVADHFNLSPKTIRDQYLTDEVLLSLGITNFQKIEPESEKGILETQKTILDYLQRTDLASKFHKHMAVTRWCNTLSSVLPKTTKKSLRAALDEEFLKNHFELENTGRFPKYKFKRSIDSEISDAVALPESNPQTIITEAENLQKGEKTEDLKDTIKHYFQTNPITETAAYTIRQIAIKISATLNNASAEQVQAVLEQDNYIDEFFEVIPNTGARAKYKFRTTQSSSEN